MMREDYPQVVILIPNREGRWRFAGGETFRSAESTASQAGTIATWRERIRAGYDAMRDRFHPEENLCANLRHASRIELVHPPMLSAEEARNLFRSFLTARQQKHRFWCWLDTVLALFASLLTPIPGPNLVFLYLAVRAFSHYRAFSGAKRALQIGVDRCAVDPLLAQYEENLLRSGEIADLMDALGKKYNVKNLQRLLEER